MQLIVPMAGFGRRFQRAGYGVPKPLIEVDGRPMVAHVVDLFPGVERVLLIANREHLAEPRWRMAEILAGLGDHVEVVAIAPHHRGPVHSVLEAAPHVDPDDDVILCMCDLAFPWDVDHFRAWVREARADGCVVCYRGFHPHLLHSVHYAFLQHEGLWATAIQEKQAFTDDPIGEGEMCSNGVYWFASGSAMLRAHRQVHARPELAIAGEHYVSQTFALLIEQGADVAVYEVEHYLQWGNPRDLEEYQHHAAGFARSVAPRRSVRSRPGTLLVPMAGLGQRFVDGGYTTPKPLLPLSGRPLAVAAALDLPPLHTPVFVVRADMPGVEAVCEALHQAFDDARIVVLDEPTDGQARSCVLGLRRADVDLDAPLVIGACDNGLLYDRVAHDALLDRADALVWGVRGHPQAVQHPRMFGWVDADEQGAVRGLAVKRRLRDPATDPMVTGTFSFARAGDFLEAAERLFAREARVRGEFYVDTLLEDVLAMGLDLRLFEVDHYEGWGTPDEYETYRYWQAHFHKWPHHPYRLERDPRVPPARLADLVAATIPRRPPPLAPRRA